MRIGATVSLCRIFLPMLFLYGTLKDMSLHALQSQTNQQLNSPFAANDAHMEAVEELFICASEYFNQMIVDIKQAKKSIDLEVYIFGEGIVGKRILAALTEAAQRGVNVRVLVDGCGTLGGVVPWRVV